MIRKSILEVRCLFTRSNAGIISADQISEHVRKLGRNTEDFFLSKALSTVPSKSDALEFKKSMGLDIVNTDDLSTSSMSSNSKTLEYTLPVDRYQRSLLQYPHGRVNVFNHKGCHFTLVGSQYQNLPLKNIYKLLSASKPDAILLQIRPDQILDNLNIRANNPETGCFSSTLYANQLIRTGFEVMPMKSMRVQIKRNLAENKILLPSVKDRDAVYYRDVYKKTILESKNKDYQLLERVSNEAIGVACFYAERNNIPIILCDQPEMVFRQNLANTHTLMQLQNMFTKFARVLAQLPDLEPQTPLAVAYQIFPEVFLEGSDKYMSTLLEYLVATKKYPRMTALLGGMQSESVHEYLLNRDVSHLADELTVKLPKGSILRDPTSEELIEKHALIDVLYYGKDILENIEQKDFKTSLEMIRRYSDIEKVDSKDATRMKYLHYELLHKYARFANLEFQSGKEVLQKEFILKMGH